MGSSLPIAVRALSKPIVSPMGYLLGRSLQGLNWTTFATTPRYADCAASALIADA